MGRRLDHKNLHCSVLKVHRGIKILSKSPKSRFQVSRFTQCADFIENQHSAQADYLKVNKSGNINKNRANIINIIDKIINLCYHL